MKQAVFLGLGLFFLTTVWTILPVGSVLAHGIHKTPLDPSYNARIIDDDIFTKTSSMSAAGIQAFLNAKVPSCRPGYTCLKNFTENGKSAAQIIYDKAIEFSINPQVILVTLQKEQSLVTDDFPLESQYQTAMGYGCPESQSVCDSQYFGFTNQIHLGTKLLRVGVDRNCGNSSSYPGWSVDARWRLGNTTTVDDKATLIQTCATGALYAYTPHRPDSGYETAGNGSHYYGNYNFINFFSSWFGPTQGDNFTLVIADNGDPRQWVLQSGIRQHIANEDVKTAWGLQNVTLNTMVGGYLGTIPEGPPLGRLMRPSGSQDIYFVDSGKSYRVTSPQMMDAWGFSAGAVSNVIVGLAQLPINSGNLIYSIKTSASPENYLVDSGTRRRYASANLFVAWEGDAATAVTISDAYFNSMPTDSDITNTKISAGAGQQEYQVVAGQKLPESANVAQLYPGSVVPNISAATINRLVTSAPASQFIRVSGSNTVYMVDGGSSHAVSSIEVLRAWGVGPSPLTNIVTQGNLNLLSVGSALSSFEADVGGQLYLMDGRRITVPAALDGAYRKTGNVYLASQALLNLSPAGETATDFIKGFNTPAVYLMDGSTLRNIGSPNQLNLWNGTGTITSVSEYVLGQFGNPGSVVGAYVSDGSSNYVIESGSKHLVSTAVGSNWQLPGPASLNSATVARLATGLALGNSLQASGQYFRVHKGTGFVTVDANIADMWGIKSAPSMNSSLVSEFLPKAMMTRFVKSVSDTRLFIVDGGTLYYLSPEQAGNLGMSTLQPTMTVDPGAADMTLGTWTGIVVRNSSGGTYVIDGGGKRSFPSSTVQNYWTNNGTVTIPQVTDGFLNLLPNNGSVDRAVKGSSANVYAAENITKRWITNPNTFTTNY
ncbi:hypothetical protein HYW35_02120, partial [Candidatus Saccharibacteria bacterium]|nr:hypothetical protein [Candidatus Saccharibacteria bacterium]